MVSLEKFDPNNTLGALTIGVLVSVFLFGIVFMQTYVYYTSFPEDHWSTKASVAFVMALESAHLLCITHSLYTLTITNYGNPRALVRPPDTLFVAVIFSSIIASFVQAFFANRVRIVSRKWPIPIICWTLAAARLVVAAIVAGDAFKMTSITQFSKDNKGRITATLVLSAAGDFFIAAALCYYLRAQRNTAHKKTAMTIDKITAWTIQTGLANSFTGLAMLTCFAAMPGNFVWLAIFMLLARMFSNSLLASLNARTILRSGHFADTHQSVGDTYVSGNTRLNAPQAMHITMTKMTESSLDNKPNAQFDKEGV